MPSAHRRRAGAGPFPRLRPAQQRAYPPLRRSSGTGAIATRGCGTIGVHAPRFPFGADPADGRRRPRAARDRLPGRGRRRPRRSGTPTAARAGPASSSGASAARWAGFTSARASTSAPRRRSRPSCASRRRCADAAARRRAAAADRRARGPGDRAQRRALPGRLLERPWTAGEDGTELDVPYEAGGAHATVEGDGELAVELDGEALRAGAGERRRRSTSWPSTAARAPPARPQALGRRCGSGR